MLKREYPYRFKKKTFTVVTVSVGVVEVKEAFIIASNSSLSLPMRGIAAVKGTCSTGALVTSYLATRTPSPGLAATFRVCCGFFRAGYMFVGGDPAKALSYIFNSTSIQKK